MTDHAQREALTDTERDELDTLLGAVLLPTFTPRERDIARIAARAALRASAPPAPEGDVGEEPVPESAAWRARHGVRWQPQCPRCGTTPPDIVVGTNGPECADCGCQSMDLHLQPEQERTTARTAIGEPPTGMREVPGTPGLYETKATPKPKVVEPEDACMNCHTLTWCVHHGHCLAESEPVRLDLDALALETGKAAARVMSCNSHRVCDLTPEAIAIIRAALDRVKERR